MRNNVARKVPREEGVGGGGRRVAAGVSRQFLRGPEDDPRRAVNDKLRQKFWNFVTSASCRRDWIRGCSRKFSIGKFTKFKYPSADSRNRSFDIWRGLRWCEWIIDQGDGESGRNWPSSGKVHSTTVFVNSRSTGEFANFWSARFYVGNRGSNSKWNVRLLLKIPVRQRAELEPRWKSIFYLTNA